MTQKYRAMLAGASLILALVACNLPFEQIAPPDEVQTAAALTLQAVLTPSGTVFTSPTSTPKRDNTSTPVVTKTASTDSLTATNATITPTYSVPMLTVLEQTNCRTGPGEEYDVVVTYLTGKELEIAGRYDQENFWLVKSNESPTGTCWLWGQYTEATGSYWAVASVTPPATVTARPPRAPGILSWEFFCTGGDLNFTVIWADNANNEAGYRIFRNGEPLVELPADSTTYTDVYALPADQNVEYYVQAYGPSGEANTSIMRMRCGV